MNKFNIVLWDVQEWKKDRKIYNDARFLVWTNGMAAWRAGVGAGGDLQVNIGHFHSQMLLRYSSENVYVTAWCMDQKRSGEIISENKFVCH